MSTPIDPMQFNIAPVKTPLLKGGISYDLGDQAASSGSSFADALGKSMKSLKDVQMKAGTMMTNYASGKQGDISQVMLAMEKSEIATNLAIQVRNRVVDGYKQIMNMQM